jgi:spore germination protein KB
VTFAIGSFVKMAACLLAASRSLAYSFGFADYRFLVTPLALGVIPGSQWFISTLLDVELSVIKTYPTSATFFQAVLPVLIWIWVEWRARKLGRGKSSPTQAGGQ